MLRCVVAGVLIASALCGCRGEAELRCEPSERYTGAVSIPPVRVPDDLSVPDESNALRLPPPSAADQAAARTARACPEQPPDYFEDRRLGDPEAGAPDPDPEPDPPDDPERQIGN